MIVRLAIWDTVVLGDQLVQLKDVLDRGEVQVLPGLIELIKSRVVPARAQPALPRTVIRARTI